MSSSEPSNVINMDERLRSLERRTIDPPGGGGDNGEMEKRVEKLEQFAQDARDRLVRIEAKQDEFIKHYATKADMTECKNSIIMWVVSAILLAQLLPPLLKKFGL